MVTLITTLLYIRLLMRIKGDSSAGPKEANCHIVEKAWQGIGSQPVGTKDLLSDNCKEVNLLNNQVFWKRTLSLR